MLVLVRVLDFIIIHCFFVLVIALHCGFVHIEYRVIRQIVALENSQHGLVTET